MLGWMKFDGRVASRKGMRILLLFGGRFFWTGAAVNSFFFFYRNFRKFSFNHFIYVQKLVKEGEKKKFEEININMTQNLLFLFLFLFISVLHYCFHKSAY